MDVSIIIVNYNTKELLRQCLNSVFEKTQDIDFELIVVDNASVDGSQQMMKADFPNVRLIESPENLGFGKANNLGAIYASGKYLFLLNSDTILLNNAVKILSDFLKDNPNAGICGGNLYDENHQPSYSYRMFLPSVFWEMNDFFFCKPEIFLFGKNRQFNCTNYIRKVGYITGADLMIRLDLFNKISGFDPDFFLYYEETELTYRVKKMGYGVYNIPQAEIIHLDGKSFSNDEYKVKLFLAHRNIFYKKTHPRSMFLSNILLLLTALFRCFLFKILRRPERLNYWKFVAKNIY